MNLLSTTSLLLKHQLDLFDAILNKKIKAGQVLELLSISLIGLAIFGAVISLAFPHWWHALNLMWKMIVLIMGSQALCLPALYVFSSIRGSRVTLAQLLLFMCASVATTAVVLLSLAPISWFFTWSTDGNTEILRVMNTVMIGFGIVFGILLLARSFLFSHKQYKAQYPEHKLAADILALWLILVIVVTVQMGQKLGPWYDPTAPRGEFSTQPSLHQNSDGSLVVDWQIPESNCAMNEVNYTVNGNTGTSGTWPATCFVIGDQYTCQATASETKDVPVGTYYDVFVTNTGCGNAEVWNQAEHDYKSDFLGYSRY